MRNEYEITIELNEKKAAYNEVAANMTPAQQKATSDEIKALLAELAACIVDGANVCPTCSNMPHGIHQPRYYEIGCQTCAYDRNGEARAIRAKGVFREEAVANWNAGNLFDKDGTEFVYFSREDVNA